MENPPPMRITARDKQIILAVYYYRLLSSPQVEALYFRSDKPRGRQTSCQRRLQLLFHHGMLDRLQMPLVLGEGRVPFVYVLDKLGANLVASVSGQNREEIGWRPQDNQIGFQFVDHTLAISDVRVAFSVLQEQERFQELHWVGERELRTADMKNRVPFYMRGARKVRVYPDGYFNILPHQVKRPAHFFLEVDQGTMSTTRWQGKIKAYRQFRQSGFSQRYFNTQNFRVLTVTSTEKRVKALKKATEKARGERYFWFASQEHVDIWNPEKLLSQVWSIAGDTRQHQLFPDSV